MIHHVARDKIIAFLHNLFEIWTPVSITSTRHERLFLPQALEKGKDSRSFEKLKLRTIFGQLCTETRLNKLVVRQGLNA